MAMLMVDRLGSLLSISLSKVAVLVIHSFLLSAREACSNAQISLLLRGIPKPVASRGAREPA